MTQAEIPAAEQYLKTKAELDALDKQVIDALQDTWTKFIDEKKVPSPPKWHQFLGQFTPEEIDTAIRSCAGKYHGKYIKGGLEGLWSYMAGTIHGARKNRSR